MKKAKIMLATMAVIALVGGSLAFNAKKFNSTIFTGTSRTSCPTALLNSTFTSTENTTGLLYITTEINTNDCFLDYITTQR
jgi:hypothetical protein